MVVSKAICLNLPCTFPYCCFKCDSLRLKKKALPFVITTLREDNSSQIVRLVLNNKKSSIRENGATKPAKVLKSLFAESHKLEKRTSRGSKLPKDIQHGINFEISESDLHAVLTALKNREEYLLAAKRSILLEHDELNRAREDLGIREKEINIFCSNHEKLEEELKEANLNLVSQATKIEELKLRLKERDQEVAVMRSELALKEDELVKMRYELATKSEIADKTNSELEHKARLLSEADEVVKKQKVEIQALHKSIIEKEQELEVSVASRKLYEEKLKIAEAKLQKETMSWLLGCEELKKLADKASKQMVEANETFEEFRRVKKLLAEVRSELVSSQKSLVVSRRQMEEQVQSLEKQRKELEEHKKSITSYMKSLKDAQVAVESERVKLRVAEHRNEKLNEKLLTEKELVKELQERLKKERSSLQKAIGNMSSLQEELEMKSNEFREASSLLQDKESNLAEAKLEIQHLRSEHASLQQSLIEKDQELAEAKDKLKEVNKEVVELKMLMSSRENQLIQATTMLKEKEGCVEIIQSQLNSIKQKATNAETVVDKIVNLTSNLISSCKDEDYNAVDVELMQQVLHKTPDDLRLEKKQLEIELRLTRDNLRAKEMEVIATQRALSIKDEELKTVMERFDTKEQELKKLKEEINEDANDLRMLYALAQERIGDKSIGDLAIEKLQLEAVQLEGEAATSALEKLTELSRELIKSGSSIDGDSHIDTNIVPHSNYNDNKSKVEQNSCFTEVKKEVARLSALTEELVINAGIVAGPELEDITP